MSTLREAAQQALEAMGSCAGVPHWPALQPTITALRKALAQETQTPCDIAEDGVCEVIDCCRNPTQPEQEPVANNPDPYHLSRILHELAGSASMCWEHVDRAGVFQSTQAADVVAAAIDEIRQRMKDAPPRREWQSLTEEEIQSIHDTYHRRMGPQEFARAIEAALRSKNHD